MHNEFTAVIERDEDWFVAYCPEIPEGNGQDKTVEEAKQNLSDAIALVLDYKREDGLRSISDSAIRDVVTVG